MAKHTNALILWVFMVFCLSVGWGISNQPVDVLILANLAMTLGYAARHLLVWLERWP